MICLSVKDIYGLSINNSNKKNIKYNYRYCVIDQAFATISNILLASENYLVYAYPATNLNVEMSTTFMSLCFSDNNDLNLFLQAICNLKSSIL